MIAVAIAFAIGLALGVVLSVVAGFGIVAGHHETMGHD
jgi:hypothetical protein